MLLELWSSMRPRRWAKNIVMLVGLAFGMSLYDPSALLRILWAAAVFCLLSGSGYLINDLVDRKFDRLHPIKRHRALAAGRLSTRLALATALMIAAICVVAAWPLGPRFFIAALGFWLLQVAYSLVLSRLVVLDLFAMAGLLLLRVTAGAWAVPVPVSRWLMVCTMLLGLLLAMGTRRHELLEKVRLGGDGHKPVLCEYSPYLMDQMIAVVTSATLLVYVLYTQSAETLAKFNTRSLVLSTPFVLHGIFRYLYLVHRRQGELSPERLILGDRPFQLTLLGYAICVGVILYF
ncbi:MAG: UbiA prenyltransferase family protein [Candidatus Alcyoniella australis]|nr:UbiA prenyltransferase family protein [Candidatus Alcyoniella australis]